MRSPIRPPVTPRIRMGRQSAMPTPYGHVVTDMADYTPPALQANPGAFPTPSVGAQYSPETSQFLQDAGMPLGPISADYQSPPGGPFGLSGEGTDAAAMAVQRFLQTQGAPRGFGAGLAAGFAGGASGARTQQALDRNATNQASLQAAQEQAKARQALVSSHASELAKERWANAPVPVTDPKKAAALGVSVGATVPKKSSDAYDQSFGTNAGKPVDNSPEADPLMDLTDPRVAAYARANGFLFPPGTKKVKQSALTIKPSPSQSGGELTASQIGDAIISGDQPPIFTNMRTDVPQIRAYLAGKKFNLSRAQNVWLATNSFTRALNSRQQVQLHTSAASIQGILPEAVRLIDRLDEIAPRGDVTPLNKIAIGAVKNFGAYGPEAQDIAQKLTTMFTNLQPELGNVYSAGGVPTDKSQALAAQTFNLALPSHALKAGMDTEGRMLLVRLNAISNAQPLLPGGDTNNVYSAATTPPAPEAPAINPQADAALVQKMGSALRQSTKAGRASAIKAVSASAAAAGIPAERIQAVIDSVGRSLLVRR